MKQYSTLKKLSEKLGLSISTISRALKDHPDISTETRKRVKDFAELMEYEPNTFATSLRTNKSKLLGVIVPTFTNLFYDSFIAAIEEEARVNSYSVLILQSGESVESELKNLDIMKKNRVEALFVSITSNTKKIDRFLKVNEMGIPVIFFDRVPQFEACNKICFADKYAAELAAFKLISKKKNKVLGLFGVSTELSITKRRLESFEATFKKNSPRTILDIHFHDEMSDAYEVTLKAIENANPPDAIFCMGDITLMGAMMAIYEKGMKIPEQIGVISISNGLIPLLYNPKITYIETSGDKLGKLAFERMMEIFEGKTFAREKFVDSVLVEGASL